MWVQMNSETPKSSAALIQRPQELELADGTRLVPDGEAKPARLDGDRDHAFCLADVRRAPAQPFAGYHLESPER